MIHEFLSERVTSPPPLLGIHSVQSPRSANVRVRGLVLYPGNLAKFYCDKNGILGGQRKHSTYIYVCRWLLTGGTFIPESLVAAVL